MKRGRAVTAPRVVGVIVYWKSSNFINFKSFENNSYDCGKIETKDIVFPFFQHRMLKLWLKPELMLPCLLPSIRGT